MSTRLIARLVPAALVLAGMSFATPASAAGTVPPWEPDPNSIGTLSFYNAAGALVTGGTDLDHIFDYAVASTDAERPTTKATAYFAFPDKSKTDTLTWYSTIATSSTRYPNTSAPAPVGSSTHPVASATPSEANLDALLDTATLDQNDGYKNIVQIRLRDSGPGNQAQDQFWTADISFDRAANTWTQVFPAVAGASTTTLTASPAGTARPGAPVTLSAAVSPSDVAGSVRFSDGADPLGSAVPVSGGTATYTTSALATGSHSFTATFTPTAGGATSTSSAVSYVVADVPGAPTAVTAAAGNARASVSWTAPSSNGGSAITGYDVRYSKDDGATWTPGPASFHTSTATTGSVTGLTNASAYVFDVAAINAVGTGAYSTASNAVTPVADTSALTITAPASVKYGAKATLGTTLTDSRTKAALPSATVTLYRRPTSSAAWTSVKALITSSKGTASYSLALSANAQFQWRYAGNATHKAVTSATKTVTVTQTITASRTPATLRHGGTVKVYGTVAPTGTGQKVSLQQLIKGRWTTLRGAVTIKKQKLPNGRTTTGFVLSVRPAVAGRYSYRVTKAATATLAAGYSAALAVRAT